MSLASKVTFGVALSGAAAVIYYVHAKQQEDIRKMHQGVIKDRERQQRRKIANTYLLEQQTQLTKLLQNQERDSEAVMKVLEGESERGI